MLCESTKWDHKVPLTSEPVVGNTGSNKAENTVNTNPICIGYHFKHNDANK